MTTEPTGPRAGHGDSPFEIVAVASSAGGVVALDTMLPALPGDFPAAVVVVQHLDPRHRSLMAEILRRHAMLPVVQGEQGQRVQGGTVYIAPPNRHLLVGPDGILSLSDGDLVHFVRPCADLLFESVAESYSDRAIAVVLTGCGQDGAMGVRAIKRRGGTVIVQDEKSSEFTGMPHAAIRTGQSDLVLPLLEIAPALVGLVMPGAVG
ncbi:MAG TPA: chemotaxis protein CheB [Candidatus Dormibacteraeota bacterium]|jgi:two-component system chemotaxis response regulator CheB